MYHDHINRIMAILHALWRHDTYITTVIHVQWPSRADHYSTSDISLAAHVDDVARAYIQPLLNRLTSSVVQKASSQNLFTY